MITKMITGCGEEIYLVHFDSLEKARFALMSVASVDEEGRFKRKKSEIEMMVKVRNEIIQLVTGKGPITTKAIKQSISRRSFMEKNPKGRAWSRGEAWTMIEREIIKLEAEYVISETGDGYVLVDWMLMES